MYHSVKLFFYRFTQRHIRQYMATCPSQVCATSFSSLYSLVASPGCTLAALTRAPRPLQTCSCYAWCYAYSSASYFVLSFHGLFKCAAHLHRRSLFAIHPRFTPASLCPLSSIVGTHQGLMSNPRLRYECQFVRPFTQYLLLPISLSMSVISFTRSIAFHCIIGTTKVCTSKRTMYHSPSCVSLPRVYPPIQPPMLGRRPTGEEGRTMRLFSIPASS
ncbi:hypothetical protein C2E23DRAFT_464275 [Lenzites betulinus]|nr:hypothetical protein C2E23DRAFT_464275 [Lenzites betulinus]